MGKKKKKAAKKQTNPAQFTKAQWQALRALRNAYQEGGATTAQVVKHFKNFRDLNRIAKGLNQLDQDDPQD
jgi:hypothetical protein